METGRGSASDRVERTDATPFAGPLSVLCWPAI